MAGKPKTFEEKWADPNYDWRNESANPADAEVQSAKALLSSIAARRPEEAATGTIAPPSTMGRIRFGLQNVLEPLKPLLPAWEIAKTAALPASFMGAGPAAAAAGIFGGQAAYDVTSPAMSNPMRALTVGASMLPLLPKAVGAARGAIAGREIPKTATPALEVLTERAAQYDDVASRIPKAADVPHTFDMTGAAGRRLPATNTAPADYVSPNAGGRLGPKGPSLNDAIEDPLFEMASEPGVRESLEALRQATRFAPPVADASSELARLGRGVVGVADDFTTQVPTLAGDAAETVAAPGFGLGPITPLDQIPTSKAAQAAQAMKQLQQQLAAKAPKTAPKPWIDELTDAEIEAAMQSGYQYGQGIPEAVGRIRGR